MLSTQQTYYQNRRGAEYDFVGPLCVGRRWGSILDEHPLATRQAGKVPTCVEFLGACLSDPLFNVRELAIALIN
jgi:hypothetical protein